jgi:hypothetical protein
VRPVHVGLAVPGHWHDLRDSELDASNRSLGQNEVALSDVAQKLHIRERN